MMQYEIGHSYSYTKPRGVNSHHRISPAEWYALMVQPQKEAARAAQLRREGVYAFFPTQTHTRYQNGAKRVSQRPTISRLIYARFKYAPNWDVMRDRGIITGVITHNEYPVAIHPDIIRQIQGLPTRAQQIEAAKREMERKLYEVEKGDRAQLQNPLLGDLVVEITEVRDGRIWWAVPGKNMKGDTKFGGVKKVVE